MAHPHASETQPNGPIPTRPDDLTIGMYVDLNCSWFRHPFASKTFTITSDKELTIIRGLGLDTVLVHPHDLILKVPHKTPTMMAMEEQPQRPPSLIRQDRTPCAAILLLLPNNRPI